MRQLLRFIERMLVGLIVAYQRALRPWLGQRCRFTPSCSDYAIEALQTQGILRGLGYTAWRLARCHPFHPGGFDPVRKTARGQTCRCAHH